MSKKINIIITESGCSNNAFSGVRDKHMHTSDCEKSSFKNAHNGEEARTHRTTLAHLVADAKVLLDLVKDTDDLPEWLETKITKAGDYLSSAARYVAGNIARDHGQLEEQESHEKEMLEPMLDQVKNNLGTLTADQIKTLLAVLSPIVSDPISEDLRAKTKS